MGLVVDVECELKCLGGFAGGGGGVGLGDYFRVVKGQRTKTDREPH